MTEARASKLPLLLIFLTVFIDLVGFGIIIPVLPTVAERYGADGLTIGLLLMSYSLMQFFFAPFWGRLSDRVGRRPVLLISLAASAAGYIIWALSSSLAGLFLSRIVAGAGNGNIAVAQAYIADVTTAQNRARGMGLIGAAFGLGFVLGPAIGGACLLMGAHEIIGFVAAAFSLTAFIMAAALLPEPEVRSNSAGERFSLNRSFYLRTLSASHLRVPLSIFFLSSFAFAHMETTLVLFTERTFHFTSADNSWMFTFIGLTMVVVQGALIGRLSKRLSERALVAAGTAITGVGLLLIGVSGSVLLLYGALALWALGAGINLPANQSMVSKLAAPSEVGAVLGVGQSLSTLGRIAGPVAGGAAYQYLGPQSPYFIAFAVMTVAFALALSLPRIGAKESVPPAEAHTTSKVPAGRQLDEA